MTYVFEWYVPGQSKLSEHVLRPAFEVIQSDLIFRYLREEDLAAIFDCGNLWWLYWFISLGLKV